MKTEIDNNSCIGWGICANICANRIEIVNGKAIINEEDSEVNKSNNNAETNNSLFGFGQGRGMGRGSGRGQGRGGGRRKW